MKTIKDEIQERFEYINSKISDHSEIDQDDFEFLLLTSLLEEGAGEKEKN